jgi:hypothetical protein
MQYDLKEIQEQTCPEFPQWPSPWLVTKSRSMSGFFVN